MNEFGVLGLLRAAGAELVARAPALLRGLLLPSLALTWFSVAKQSVEDVAPFVALSLPIWLLYALFASTCHRIVLQGDRALPQRFGLYWTPRETRIALYMFAIGSIAGAAYFIAALVIGSVAVAFQKLGVSLRWIANAIILLSSMVVFGRLALVLPASAIGAELKLGDAWRLSAGNALRLGLALFVPTFAIHEIAEQVPTGHSFVIGGTFAFTMLGAFDIAVLTVAYRALARA